MFLGDRRIRRTLATELPRPRIANVEGFRISHRIRPQQSGASRTGQILGGMAVFPRRRAKRGLVVCRFLLASRSLGRRFGALYPNVEHSSKRGRECALQRGGSSLAFPRLHGLTFGEP